MLKISLCAELSGSCFKGIITLKNPRLGYFRVSAILWCLISSEFSVSVSGCKTLHRHAHSPTTNVRVVICLTPLHLLFFSHSFLPVRFDNPLRNHLNQFSYQFAASFGGILAHRQGPASSSEDWVLWNPSCCNCLDK